MAPITIDNVTKGYPNGYKAVDAISLDIADGEFMILVGPSGCGKSTLLRRVAGLLRGSGVVTVPPVAPGRASTGLVFQDPRLLPWLTVAENITFALDAARVPRAEQAGRIDPLLARVGLSDVRTLRPAALSGGMAQRVALVRTLALRPQVLLLDEPFAAVDPLLREDLQAALQELLVVSPATVLLVTHDIGEALVLADRVLVLRGRPVHVEADVSVDEPYPRGLAFRLDTRFQLLQGEVRRALGATPGPPR